MVRHFLLLSFFLISLVVGRGAADAQWVPTNGPYDQVLTYGGYFRSPVSVGSDLFVITQTSQILISTDSGRSWMLATSELAAKASVLYADSGMLYAGTDSGLYVSSDLGKTWRGIPIRSPEPSIAAIASSGGNLLVAGVFDSTVLSTDDGATWTTVPLYGMQEFASAGPYLFVRGIFSGIFRSSNNGLSWEPTDTLPTRAVRELISSGSDLFASTFGHLYRSTDFGDSWVPADTGLTISLLGGLAGNGSLLFTSPSQEGVYRSTDEGRHWSPTLGEGLPPFQYGLFLNGGVLYATGESGLYRSTDSGSHWYVHSPLSTAIPALRMLDTVGSTLFAGTEAGLFRSRDSGTTWSYDSAGMGSVPVTSIVESDGVMIAGTNGHGVFRSTNGGTSWIADDSGLKRNEQVRSLRAQGGSFFAGTVSGIFRSADSGSPWTDLNIPHITSIVFVGKRLLVSTSDVDLYYRDSTANWNSVLNGPPFTNTVSLAVSHGMLFAGTSGAGIWRSTDSGVNWDEMNNRLTDSNITRLIAADGELFAGSASGRIFFSSDDGSRWNYMGGAFSADSAVPALAVQNGILYAGTRDSGVWRRSLSDLASSVSAQARETEPTISIFPDPVAGGGTISFSTSSARRVAVLILNPLGDCVMHVTETELPAGRHSFSLPAGLASGTYECILKSGASVQCLPFVIK